MRTFDYKPATSVDEALALIKEHGDDAELIAGGTSLVLMMKQGLVQPGVVVGLQGLRDLQQIRTVDGALEIGALVTHRAVETSPVVKAFAPALAEAFSRI